MKPNLVGFTMNMQRVFAALTAVFLSILIAQTAIAADEKPRACLIARCTEGFSLDASSCRCVSDRSAQAICELVIRCVQGFQVDPKTCRCTKGEALFEKAEIATKGKPEPKEPKPSKPEPKEPTPSKPTSGDPTPPKPMPWDDVKPPPNPIPRPTIPCPPQRLCWP